MPPDRTSAAFPPGMSTFSSLILERGAVSMDQLEASLRRQALNGGDLGTNLLELGALDEAELHALLAVHCGLPPGPAGVLPAPADGARERLSAELAREHLVYPLRQVDGVLEVAVAEPLKPQTERDLASAVGIDLRPVSVTPIRLREALARHCAMPLSRRYRALLDRLVVVAPCPAVAGDTPEGERADDIAEEAEMLIHVVEETELDRPYRRMAERAEGVIPTTPLDDEGAPRQREPIPPSARAAAPDSARAPSSDVSVDTDRASPVTPRMVTAGAGPEPWLAGEPPQVVAGTAVADEELQIAGETEPLDLAPGVEMALEEDSDIAPRHTLQSGLPPPVRRQAGGAALPVCGERADEDEAEEIEPVPDTQPLGSPDGLASWSSIPPTDRPRTAVRDTPVMPERSGGAAGAPSGRAPMSVVETRPMGGYGLVAIDPAAVEVGAPPPVRLAAPPDVPFLRPGAHQRTLVSGTDDEGEPGRDPWHAAVQRAQRSLLAEEDENDEEADDHDDRPASLPPSRQTDHGSPSRPRVVGPTPPPLSPFAGVESAHDTSDRARWVRSAGSLDIPDTTPYPLPAADGSRITQPWDAPARPLRRVTNPYVELPGPHHIRRTVVDSLEAEDSVRPGGVPPAERYCFRGPFLREDAELALVRATEVGDVLAILQRYTQQFFERTVLLVVTQSCAVVRQWHNVQLEITTRFSLDAPSSLQRAADGGEPLIAELGAIGVDALFRRSIGGSPGRVGLVPVCLRGRCVALVYGDDGESVDPGAVAQVSSFAASCGASIARVIVAHKRPGG